MRASASSSRPRPRVYHRTYQLRHQSTDEWFRSYLGETARETGQQSHHPRPRNYRQNVGVEPPTPVSRLLPLATYVVARVQVESRAVDSLIHLRRICDVCVLECATVDAMSVRCSQTVQIQGTATHGFEVVKLRATAFTISRLRPFFTLRKS